jgi:hypothetical protein
MQKSKESISHVSTANLNSTSISSPEHLTFLGPKAIIIA